MVRRAHLTGRTTSKIISLAGSLILATVVLGVGPAAAENDVPVTTPANFRADVDFSSVTVEWDPSTSDADIAIYFVQLDGRYLWTVEPTMTFHLERAKTYTLQVQAQDEEYNRSAWSEPFEFTTSDEFPVTTPANLRVTDSPGSMTVEWDPSTSAAGVMDYTVTVSGGRTGPLGRRTFDTTTTFDLPPGGELDVTVRARDHAYRWSDWSDPVEVTLAPAEDWEPPGVPTNLRATLDSRGHVEFVEWDAAPGGSGPLTYHLIVVEYETAIESTRELRVQPMSFADCAAPGADTSQPVTLVITATSHGFESPPSEPITLCFA